MLNRSQIAELYNLYHLARTALVNDGHQTKYDRKLWATAEFCKSHPEFTDKTVYLTFEKCDAGIIGY